MQYLDRQLAGFKAQLQSEVILSAEEAIKVATFVSTDIRFLPEPAKKEIAATSPVPLSARLDELVAFQQWADLASSIQRNPAVTRAQVIVQIYVCLVYLKDACFEEIARRAAHDSVAARCAAYLSSGTVRDFRNAFSHANWCYKSDFSGLECWVLENARRKEGRMRHFQVSQQDLDFWQALARCVAYATYTQLTS